MSDKALGLLFIQTCSACGDLIPTTMELSLEAIEEQEALFPNTPIEECVVYCDPCFKDLVK